RESVLDEVADYFRGVTVIVRSSADGEDSHESAHAGEFLSVPFVDPLDREKLGEALDAVLASFGDTKDGGVLIQEQVLDIAMSGVLFTYDLEKLAPYYVMSYDDVTGSHDSVTAGTGREIKTWVRFRGS